MRHGHRVAIVVGVLAAFAIGAVMVTDRIMVHVAEGRIAQQVQTELGKRQIRTASQPTVAIAGFPFLTQVMAGEYGQITISVDTPESGGIRFDTMRLTVNRVRTDLGSLAKGSGQVTAASIRGRALLGWPALRQAIRLSGLPVAVDASAIDVSASGNAVKLRFPVTLSGQRVTCTATGALAAVSGAVRFKVSDVAVEGIPQTPTVTRLVEQYRKQLTVGVNVPELPYRLAITNVQTNQTGISVVADARDAVLAG